MPLGRKGAPFIHPRGINNRITRRATRSKGGRRGVCDAAAVYCSSEVKDCRGYAQGRRKKKIAIVIRWAIPAETNAFFMSSMHFKCLFFYLFLLPSFSWDWMFRLSALILVSNCGLMGEKRHFNIQVHPK